MTTDDPKNICMEGPFEIEMKVGITDGERTGTVTFGFGHGETPTPERVQAALVECAKQAAAQGFDLMNRHDYIQDALGIGHVAVPGPQQFPNAAAWQFTDKE